MAPTALTDARRSSSPTPRPTLLSSTAPALAGRGGGQPPRRRRPRPRAAGSRAQRRATVVVESVCSVLDNAATLAELAAQHDAVVLVDAASGIGFVGQRSEGLAAQLRLAGLEHVVLTATLSTSIAAQGGAVLGHPAVREHLVTTARLFS